MDREKRAFDVIGQIASLRRYALSLVRRPTDAEDLVHDALVKAYERRHTFRKGANLRSWLFSILHNTHVDRQRSEAARLRREEALAAEADAIEEARQEDGLRLRQIREAFLQLPEEQREALHLVALEDLSYEEAAEVLKIPVGTLMSRVSRARARLRELEAGGPGRPHLRVVGGDND